LSEEDRIRGEEEIEREIRIEFEIEKECGKISGKIRGQQRGKDYRERDGYEEDIVRCDRI
jgi:hypothetical protein